MQYFKLRNDFKNTLRTFSGWFCRKHPIYKNKISLNPPNKCSFMRVFYTVYESLYGNRQTYRWLIYMMTVVGTITTSSVSQGWKSPRFITVFVIQHWDGHLFSSYPLIYIGPKRVVECRALAFTKNLAFTWWKFHKVNSKLIKLMWNRAK